MSQSEIITLNDRLTFGKYKDKLLRWIITHDPEYILWCQENIEWFEIDVNAEEKLEFELSNCWDDDTRHRLKDEDMPGF